MVAEKPEKPKKITQTDFMVYMKTTNGAIEELAQIMKWQAMKIQELDAKCNGLRDSVSTIYITLNAQRATIPTGMG